MRPKVTVAVLVVVLAGYLVLVGYQGVLLAGTGQPVGIALGLAILVLPVVGAFLVYRELRFGAATSQLAKRLDGEGGWPTDELPRRPSGRPDRTAADGLFDVRRRAVEEAPGDWRCWFRLGLAYDDAGDRKRARHAMRKAISLAREES